MIRALILLVLCLTATADTIPSTQVRSRLYDVNGNGLTSTLLSGKQSLDVNMVAPTSFGISSSVGSPVFVAPTFGGSAIDPRTRQWTLDDATDSVTVYQGGTWSFPLPSGISTSALQTAGNASLLSIDSKTPSLVSGRVPVDGSGVTQPVSISSLPLPTGASTSTLQTSGNSILTSIDGKTPTLGQKPMTGSVPVTLASDQPTLPVSVTFPPSLAVTQSGVWSVGRTWTLSPSDQVTVANFPSLYTIATAAKGITTSGSPTSTNVDADTQALDVVLKGTSSVAVNNFPATQPISAASLPLPLGAATSALQTTANSLLTSIDGKLTSPIDVSVVSFPGTVAVTQSTSPWVVSGTVTANIGTIDGLATETTLAALNTKVPSGLTVTSNRLMVDGSAVTQPVSGPFLTDAELRASDVGVTVSNFPSTQNVNVTNSSLAITAASLPLPTGAATSALQTSGNSILSSIDTKLTAPLVVDGSGVTQPISGSVSVTGSVAVTGPLTDTQLRASDVGVSVSNFPATQSVTQGTSPWVVSGTVNLGTIAGIATEATLSALNAKVTAVDTDNVTVVSSALPTGAATSALQTSGNSSLTSIDGKLPANLTVTASRLLVDGSGVTQPVSGTVTANAGTGTFQTNVTNASIPVTQSGVWSTDRTWTLGSGTDSVASVQSGSWTVTANAGTNLNTSLLALDTSVTGLQVNQGSTTTGQKGNLVMGAVTSTAPSYTTAQTSPLSLTTSGALRTDSSATTQPVSGTVTANLGTIADVATETTLSALNTKVPSGLTVTSTRLLVDGSGVTQPISATALPLPTGASTSALQTTGNNSLANIDTDLDVALSTRASEATQTTQNTRIGDLTETAPATDTDSSGLNGRLQRIAQRLTSLIALLPTSLGQKTSANSLAVVVASDQSAIPASQSGVWSVRTQDGAGNNLESSTTIPAEAARGLVTRIIPYDPPTFVVLAEAVVLGNNKSMIAIQNTGTGVIRIKRVELVNTQTTAVTGVVTNFRLHRIASFTGGTALTISPYDTNFALPAGITAATGSTIATEGAVLHSASWSSDEWGSGTVDVEAQDHTQQELNPWLDIPDESQGITVRNGQGIHVRCATNTTAGSFKFRIVFTTE